MIARTIFSLLVLRTLVLMSILVLMTHLAHAGALQGVLHSRLTELQYELTICRSPRQLRLIEGAIRSTRLLLVGLVTP